jgi:hypothetical protein
MTTDPQGRLATRSELYGLASANCVPALLALIAINADHVLVTSYVMCTLGLFFYYGMKARWVNNPDPRRAEFAAILDSARNERLNVSNESRDEMLKLIADLQSQLVQLRRKVEGC